MPSWADRGFCRVLAHRPIRRSQGIQGQHVGLPVKHEAERLFLHDTEYRMNARPRNHPVVYISFINWPIGIIFPSFTGTMQLKITLNL